MTANLETIQHRIMNGTTYFGITCLKNPIDFWVYQEIISAQKPDLIVEIGTFQGGSALALAHLCEALGNGRVVSVDHGKAPDFFHPRIEWITGDALGIFEEVKEHADFSDRVMVIEDSSHEYKTTLKILEVYSQLVTPGSYLICEDTICHHGLDVGPNPGPYEAVETFLKTHKNFESDRTKESFGITWNPTGYLKRIA